MGVVILTIAFLVDWNGECDNDIKNININSIPLALEQKSITSVDENDIHFNEYIHGLYNEWNYCRTQELNRYRNGFDKFYKKQN